MPRTTRPPARVSRPGFLLAVLIAVSAWLVVNIGLGLWGRTAPDPYPFNFLQAVLSALAVYISLAILSAQRRATQLADLRARVTLEHTILAEHKAAKMIELMEGLRRDDPMIRDRFDHQASAMSSPTDPQAIAAAIAVEAGEEKKEKAKD